MPKYSIVIPVYNRPEELDELLESLTHQTYSDFEVIIVEDGSTLRADHLLDKYKDLELKYFTKENGGQGFARNFGYERCKGDFFIVFDSDCLIPPDYLFIVDNFLSAEKVDAYGGPDAALPTFTTIQRTINFSMTSFLTTGGTRGNKQHLGTYHPRSFNMGISREVFEKTNGYLIPYMGEDMEFSTRIIKMGFRTALIPEAFVYHKRRTDLIRFFKQLNYFGRARINLSRFHPEQVKLIHLFPTLFILGLFASMLLSLLFPPLGFAGMSIYFFYFLLIFFEAWFKSKSLSVALLSPWVVLLQMAGYGYGLVYEWIQKIRGVNPNKKYIELYK